MCSGINGEALFQFKPPDHSVCSLTSMLTSWQTSSSLPLLVYWLGLLVVDHFLSLSGIVWNLWQKSTSCYPPEFVSENWCLFAVSVSLSVHTCRRESLLKPISLSISPYRSGNSVFRDISLTFTDVWRRRRAAVEFFQMFVFFFSLWGAKEPSRRVELALITMDKATRGIREREREVCEDEERERKVALRGDSVYHSFLMLDSTSRWAGNEAEDTHWPAATCRLTDYHRNNLNS